MAFKMKGFSAFTKTDDDIVNKPKLKMTKKTGKFKTRPTPPPPRGGGVVKN